MSFFPRFLSSSISLFRFLSTTSVEVKKMHNGNDITVYFDHGTTLQRME